MIASIKEALAAARQFVEHAPGSNAKATLAKIDAALASLSYGEARERIARIIDPDAFAQFTHSFRGQNAAIKKADAILATGCVPTPTPAMIDAGVAFALNATLSGEYRWSQYVADLYKTMSVVAIRAGRGEG